MNTDNIRIRKKALNITTAQLAYLADLPVGTVSKIITGETKNPKQITIDKLNEALIKEESRMRISAYLKEMKEYYESHPEILGGPNDFEPIYRKRHNLEDKPLELADSLSEEYPIWGNIARKPRHTEKADDFLQAGNENRFIELLDGTRIYNEAPSLNHQLIVKSINRQIESYIAEKGGDCRVFDMGINVRLDEDEDTILIPDILVLCDEAKYKPFGILGAPDWVIEVVSKSTRRYDFKQKTYKYLMNGVRELWLVDMERKIVVVYTDGEYMLSHIYPFDESIPVGIYDKQLTITVSMP